MVAGDPAGDGGRPQESRLELLEREGRFPELATELATLAQHARGAARVALLARLGEVRLRLDDVARAISAFRECLERDSKQPVARRWLEVMLAEPEHALEAAEVLQPIYEAEFRTDPHSATMLLALFELRAGKSSDEDERIALFAQLGAYFDQAALPAERQKEISARMLRRAAQEWPGGVPKWIERVVRSGDPAFRAEAFGAALEQTEIETGTVQELAFAQGEALDEAGRAEEALRSFERALATDPSSPEVVARIDVLASRAGESVEQRMARYRAAIESASEPERRAALRYALGVLIDTAIGDGETAMDLWKLALSEVPTMVRAHEALISGYLKLGNDTAVERELERAQSHLSGEERRGVVLRLAESLASRGELARAIARGRELIRDASFEDPVLYVLERFGYDAKDFEIVRAVFERRVQVAPDRDARAHALEGLGEFENERLADKSAAARAIGAAAEQWLLAPDDVAEAERLFLRALELAPADAALASRLFDLRLARDDWNCLPDALGVLLDALADPAAGARRVVAIEHRAAQVGAVGPFAVMVDAALARLADSDVANARALIGAKARLLVLAGHLDEAADLYENLIDAFCEEDDVRAYVGLVESSSNAEWRHQKRRWLLEWRTARAEDPVDVLVHWALVEEQEFNDVPAAVALLERASFHDGQRELIFRELARLRMANDDPAGSIEALAKLRELGAGDPTAIELTMAELLVERVDQPADALPLLEAVLKRVPSEPRTRALLLRLAGSSPLYWREACALLEQAVGAAPAAADGELLNALLTATEARARAPEAPDELSAMRRRWYEQLLARESGPLALEAMERAAAEFPNDPAIWDSVETLARRVSDAPSAVRAYERAIRRTRDPQVAETLGRRLIAFADQHVDNPRLLGAALEAMLELVPTAGWAFERVKFALGSEQRWSTLFPLYEQRIRISKDADERAALLDEAAIAARDVAADPDRAIRYWEEFYALRPNDARVDLALERLYERQRKLRELVAHLWKRAPGLDGDDRVRLEERIAGLFIELGDARAALEVLEGLPKQAAAGAALLERLFALPLPAAAAGADGAEETREAERRVRGRAAKLLKERYASAGRDADVARIVRAELIELLEKLAELELRLGNARAEFDARGQLLKLEPAVDAYRKRLTELAETLDARIELSELIVASADRAGDRALFARLLFEAASLASGDRERAIAIHTRILEECERREDKLEAARQLEQLLLAAEKPAERCAVLERIAELELDGEKQKQAWLEAARVALEELAEPERAARAYRVLLEREPSERKLHDGLVKALRASKRFRELGAALEARAALEPASARARRDLAELAALLGAELGDAARAVETWREIRRRFGTDSESFDALSALLEGERRFPELAELLADEAENARVKGPLYQRLAEVHRTQTGDLRAALDAYVRANDVVAAGELVVAYATLLSDDPALTLDLASKLERAGRVPEAERVLRKQIEHYGPRRPNESVLVHLRLADLLKRGGDPAQALAELLAASERHPGSAELQAALAESAAEGGDLARAEQSYRALLLLPIRPGSAITRAEVYLRLADLAQRRRASQAADDHVASAFEAALGSDEEAAGLERALKERGRQDLLERAITARLERTREPAKVLSALADLLDASAVFGETDPVLAERVLKLADRSGKDLEGSEVGPKAFWALVDVYDKLGQKERAIQALEQIASRAATAEERDGYALEVTRRLLELPGRREDGMARLWDLVRRDAGDEARGELLLHEAGDGEALDELLALIDDQIALSEKRHDSDRLEVLSVRRAKVLERAGRLPEALAAFRRLATSPPHRKRALGEVVRLLEALGAPESELCDAHEALLDFESGKLAAEHAARLAGLRREQGDREGLERALERGFAADPSRAELRDELLALLAEKGRSERSAELLEQAVKALPEDGVLRLRLAQAYRACGAAPQALAALDVALAAGASEIEVRRERAVVLETLGRAEAALDELEALIALGAGLEDDLLQAITRTGVWKEAERWALRAADLSGERDKRARARQMLEHWAEKQPENVGVLSKLGRLASLDRDFPIAIEAFRKLARLERGVSQRSAVLALARVCEAAGRPEDAVAEVERALAEGADTTELRRELGKLYAQSGAKAKQAALLVEEARGAKGPARAELLVKAGELFAAEAAWTDVSAVLEELAREDPERVEGVALRTRVLASQRGAAQARSYLEQFLSELKKRDRRHGRLFRLLAELHLAEDELAEALAPLSQAHQLDKSDPDAAFTLGLLAFDLDQLELTASALRGFLAIKESASNGPQLSRAYFVLACVEHRRGQKSAARRMASRALEVDSGNEQARRLLGALA